MRPSYLLSVCKSEGKVPLVFVLNNKNKIKVGLPKGYFPHMFEAALCFSLFSTPA